MMDPQNSLSANIGGTDFRNVVVASPSRRRLISRSMVRKASFTRDILASIKDAGLILAAASLLFFHDQVSEYLISHGFLREDSAQVVDIQRSLVKLNQAVDSQPVDSVSPSTTAVLRSRKAVALSQRAVRAEQRLLRSEDAAFVSDWTVVVATTRDAGLAAQIKAELGASDFAVAVARKGDRLKVFLRTDTPDATQSALNRVRLKYPYAISGSLRAWCNPQGEQEGVENCKS